MRVTSKGQVTIPRDLRQLAGIAPNSEVIFALEDGRITIAPKRGAAEHADAERLRRFMEALQRLEGAGDPEMNADDVMALTRDR